LAVQNPTFLHHRAHRKRSAGNGLRPRAARKRGDVLNGSDASKTIEGLTTDGTEITDIRPQMSPMDADSARSKSAAVWLKADG